MFRLLALPLIRGQLVWRVLVPVVTDSTLKIGVVPRRGEGVDSFAIVSNFVESISLMLLEDDISHRIPRILRFSSIDVSYASVFEPTEFVASFATTAGAVFEKASDTSLWVLRAKLRNSSSDSAHCMGKSVNFCGFCVR